MQQNMVIICQKTSFVNRNQKICKTLENFLETSIEDILDIDGIWRQLPIYAKPFLEQLKKKGAIRVLDIGSGNGAKSIYLAKRFHEIGFKVTIDSIEPKTNEIKKLIQNYRGENQKYLGRIYQTTLGNVQLDEKYDLVLAIHSLYQFPRDFENNILFLEKIGQLVSEHGAGIIISNSSEGDMHKLKRELYAVRKQDPLSPGMIARTLEQANVPYRVGKTIEVEFSLDGIIDQSEAEIGKSMAFLFSDSLDDEPLEKSYYVEIGQWVRKNMRYKNGFFYLSAPDITFWTYASSSFSDS